MEVVSGLPCEASLEGIVEHLQTRVKTQLPLWRAAVAEEPGRFAEVESEILRFCRELAGPLTAAVLLDESVGESVEQQAEQIVERAEEKLQRVYQKPRLVRFLCGMVLKLKLSYFAPAPQALCVVRPRTVGHRSAERVGLYPEAAAVGIRQGISPALQSEAGRLVALMPSIRFAQQELERAYVKLDIKTVRRIALQLGAQALGARRDELEQWRAGKLPVGLELAGKRVAVVVDGGRVRVRRKRKGRKTRKGRHRFVTAWREPKLLVIYVLDEHGAIDRKHRKLIDGTLLGPDALMELAAFHLHRLGAAAAEEVVFLGDGADWIWNRTRRVIQLAGLRHERCFEAVDLSHVMGHIAEALKTREDWSPKERKRQRTLMKNKLLAGHLDELIDALKALETEESKEIVGAQIEYLTKRRHLLDYPNLRQRKLPIGSGAVESAIRRVINLRLKGCGMFWEEENVEVVLHMRAQALSERWEEMMSRVRAHCRRTRNLDWSWKPTLLYEGDTEEKQFTENKNFLDDAA